MKITANPVNASATKVVELSAKKNSSAEVTSAQLKSTGTDNFFAINSKIASASDIDMQKVNTVREMLREGTLTLDTEILSAALLAMHRK